MIVRDLHVWKRDREVLKGLSFECDGGLTGVLGPNGAGKTTLLKSLLHIGESRQTGQVKIGNLDVAEMTPRERAGWMAYVPQEIYPSAYSVLEFAVTGRTPYLRWLEQPGEAEYAMARQALEELGIGHLVQRTMDSISGGERKLAYLARAKVQKARWLLLDEPAAGLDFGRQHQFFQTLAKQVQNGSQGAIVTIHDPVLAYTYCDRILMLQEGRLAGNLSCQAPDFEREFGKLLGRMYGGQAVFADVDGIRTLIWRKETIC